MTNPTSGKDPREDPRYLADDNEPGAVLSAYIDSMSLGAWVDDDMDAFRAAVLAELREIGPHSICKWDWDSGEDVEREVSPEESFEEVSYERIPMSRRPRAILSCPPTSPSSGPWPWSGQ